MNRFALLNQGASVDDILSVFKKTHGIQHFNPTLFSGGRKAEIFQCLFDRKANICAGFS